MSKLEALENKYEFCPECGHEIYDDGFVPYHVNEVRDFDGSCNRPTILGSLPDAWAIAKV